MGSLFMHYIRMYSVSYKRSTILVLNIHISAECFVYYFIFLIKDIDLIFMLIHKPVIH